MPAVTEMRSRTMAEAQTAQAPLPERVRLADVRRADAAPEDAMVDRLAFALAHERPDGLPAGGVETLRHEAAAQLSTFAFRYLHNQVEEVRRQAMAEQAARLRAPPGFLRLVAANLVALAIGSGVWAWAAANPDLVQRATAAIRGAMGG